MNSDQLSALAQAIDHGRALIESSHRRLLEIDQFIVQAESGGLSEWLESLVEQRSKVEGDLEQARRALHHDEDTYRRALAN